MPDALQVHNFQTLLTRLTHAANHAVAQLWHATQQWQDISDGYPATIDPYLAGAAQLSAQWYHSLAPDAAFAVQPGPLPPAEQLSKNADFAFSTANPLASLQGATERHVFATSGATIVHNADREHVRYARYASATACAFCRVLATRTKLYTSAQSATRVGASGRTRGSRAIGDLYHDNCHCVAVPIRPGDDYQPPGYVKQWEDDYNAANDDPDVHSFDQIVNHMRRTDYARSTADQGLKTAGPAPAPADAGLKTAG
jgi:hypothetical protein